MLTLPVGRNYFSNSVHTLMKLHQAFLQLQVLLRKMERVGEVGGRKEFRSQMQESEQQLENLVRELKARQLHRHASPSDYSKSLF